MKPLAFFPQTVSGWGRVAPQAASVATPSDAGAIEAWLETAPPSLLAIGARRSYGDVGVKRGGALLDMTGLSRLQAFDPLTGVLTANAGVLLADVMAAFTPRGWFPPTTPGTRMVTLGGAVANDVHGKNHGKAGTFGRHVLEIELLRSDRGRLRLSPTRDPELFAATIGGLGLTGVILSVTLQLVPIRSAYLTAQTVPFDDLQGFLDLSRDSDAFEHTVAWVDCTATGRAVGRGVFSRANWAVDGRLEPHPARMRSLPLPTPDGLLNPLTLRAFNTLVAASQRIKPREAMAHYASVFHPLDSVADWNRFYGSRGFYQYQCVVPLDQSEALRELLRIVAKSGEGSFLAVLKAFGARPSPGLLSFPMPGYTLALDFRNRGAPTLALLDDLDRIVSAAGGRLYPAKDARMSRTMFESGYPELDRYRNSRDPACRSDFSERMAL